MHVCRLTVTRKARNGANCRGIVHGCATEHDAIALRQGSALRESVNQALLEKTTSAEWQEPPYSYLGE